MKAGDRFEYEGVIYELHPNMIQIVSGKSNCRGCELASKNSRDCCGPGLPNCGSYDAPAGQQFIFKRVFALVDPRQLSLFQNETMTPQQQKLIDKLREIDPDAAAHYTAIILFGLAGPVHETPTRLWEAFHWGSSPQGIDYWCSLAENLRDGEPNHERKDF